MVTEWRSRSSAVALPRGKRGSPFPVFPRRRPAMADVIEFRRKPQEPPPGSLVVEPYAARLIAQGNEERFAAVAKADAVMKRDRAKLNRLDLEVRETSAELSRAETEFRAACGGRRHREPLPTWAFLAFVLITVLGEWAIAYELLDYLAVRGHPNPEATFASYFAENGFFEGLTAAFSDYFNEKAVLSLSLAAGIFVLAKITGSRIAQRAAGRKGGVPDWAVAVANASFFAMAGAFAYLREAQLAHEGIAELMGLWPVFLAVQCFAYVAAASFAAWMADPDPEAERLSRRIDGLRVLRDRKWGERCQISERGAEAWAKATDEAAETVHRILRMVAAYRDHNFANRPPGDPPPAFMLATVGEEVFAPLPLDPPADAPADDVMESVLDTETMRERYGIRTANG